MKITIEQDDFHQLSNSAKEEILHLLSKTPGNMTTTQSGASEFKGLVDLTLEMTGKFMEGITNFQTRERLRIIAQNGGRASWGILDEWTDGNLNQGFQSGVTRRIRNLLKDPEVSLLGWREGFDENGNKHIELGEYYISPVTLRSLLDYFEESDLDEWVDNAVEED